MSAARFAFLLVIAGLFAPVGAVARDPVLAQRHMVVAANPLATAAGLRVLRAGGSAVDAAVAVQAVLGLVEPQSSGIGGGAFMLHYDGASGAVAAYDGRETAPAAATPDLFLRPDGTPMKFYDAVVGGRSVGVPGVLRLLEMAQARHGRLPWRGLFDDAIRLATDGFAVSPRLHQLLVADKHLPHQAAAARYFYAPDGTPRPAGSPLRNGDYAATLTAVAAGGADAFYGGPIAADIVAAVQGATANPGHLTLADLAAYRARQRDALCRPYRQWTVCGMPPPTSGGIATLQILGLLQGFDLAALPPGGVEAVHLISEASRLAYADRDTYVADADFEPVPVSGLLDGGYLRERAGLIARDRSMGAAPAGEPPMKKGEMGPLAPNLDGALPSTSHFVIVDDRGDVVSMTTSVENAFGSRLLVRGFLLNNQLTDFSFAPERDGRPVANRVAPGKRPRSSMDPVIVLDRSGKPALALGSPGGSRIIAYDTPVAGLAAALTGLGHEVKPTGLNSGLHGIRWRHDGRLEGGADYRREGLAQGD